MKNTSWKTLVAGMVAAVGAYLKTVPDPQWLSGFGTLLESAGLAMLGWVARDDSVSSAMLGIDKKKLESK